MFVVIPAVPLLLSGCVRLLSPAEMRTTSSKKEKESDKVVDKEKNNNDTKESAEDIKRQMSTGKSTANSQRECDKEKGNEECKPTDGDHKDNKTTDEKLVTSTENRKKDCDKLPDNETKNNVSEEFNEKNNKVTEETTEELQQQRRSKGTSTTRSQKEFDKAGGMEKLNEEIEGGVGQIKDKEETSKVGNGEYLDGKPFNRLCRPHNRHILLKVLEKMDPSDFVTFSSTNHDMQDVAFSINQLPLVATCKAVHCIKEGNGYDIRFETGDNEFVKYERIDKLLPHPIAIQNMNWIGEIMTVKDVEKASQFLEENWVKKVGCLSIFGTLVTDKSWNGLQTMMSQHRVKKLDMGLTISTSPEILKQLLSSDFLTRLHCTDEVHMNLFPTATIPILNFPFTVIGRRVCQGILETQDMQWEKRKKMTDGKLTAGENICSLRPFF